MGLLILSTMSLPIHFNVMYTAEAWTAEIGSDMGEGSQCLISWPGVHLKLRGRIFCRELCVLLFVR